MPITISRLFAVFGSAEVNASYSSRAFSVARHIGNSSRTTTAGDRPHADAPSAAITSTKLPDCLCVTRRDVTSNWVLSPLVRFNRPRILRTRMAA